MSAPNSVAAVIDAPAPRPAATRRVLYIDMGSGRGGASRSLFLLVTALDRRRWNATVLLRPGSAIAQSYRAAGIPVHEVPGLATFRPADRNNWLSYLRYRIERRGHANAIAQIRAIAAAEPIDLIHVNHENIALVAPEIAAALRRPWICHLRASIRPSRHARNLYRRIAREAAFAICISEQTDADFRAMAPGDYSAKHTAVVHNAFPHRAGATEPLPAMCEPAGALRVLSLSHIDRDRGVDRIVDVAEVLAKRGRKDIVFYLAGSVQQRRLGFWPRRDLLSELQDRVRAGGLSDTVRFLGYVAVPEQALAAAHVLIRLRRQMNPWGRDIIEAMAAGLPVVTLGTFRGFVEPGVNGFLADRFDPEEIADYLETLRGDEALRAQIAAANRAKAVRMFDGTVSAAAVEAIYDKVLA